MKELDFTIKEAVNEPIKEYMPGSDEKTSLKIKLDELKATTFDIPLIIFHNVLQFFDVDEISLIFTLISLNPFSRLNF